MVKKEIDIDITDKVCPFCLFLVKKELSKIAKGDKLIVKCDHPPAATDTIPYAMEKSGNECKVIRLKPGLWKLNIVKK